MLKFAKNIQSNACGIRKDYKNKFFEIIDGMLYIYDSFVDRKGKTIAGKTPTMAVSPTSVIIYIGDPDYTVKDIEPTDTFPEA